ncbi:MAG: NAD(P)/FAD-dependent oxidoreductase, partial [Mycobacterium sp.]
MAATHIHDTLIVGAGFTGLGTAIKLRQAGVDDIVVVERADRVGGTWRDNTYPGVACDIPSLLYSFSFVKNPTWSRAYPSGAEISGHIEDLTDQHGLRPLIRFNTEITGLSFDEDAGVWTATTNGRKRFQARTVVLAGGPLADHKLPDIRGIDTYRGHKIHSAAWDHDYDFTGKRVAVIGTGASAVQIVPELVKTAEFVKVFQRTPGWVLPRLDVPMPAAVQSLFAKVPAAQELARQALFWGHEASATALVWNTPLSRLVGRLGKAYLRRSVA